jgi:hypothetical protein
MPWPRAAPPGTWGGRTPCPAPPQGVAQLEADGMVRIIEDRPLLEGAVSDDHALFSALGQLEAATMRLLDAG